MFWFVSWEDISLGISLDIKQWHIDLHIPFGWIRIGFENQHLTRPNNEASVKWRQKTLIRIGDEYASN